MKFIVLLKSIALQFPGFLKYVKKGKKISLYFLLVFICLQCSSMNVTHVRHFVLKRLYCFFC